MLPLRCCLASVALALSAFALRAADSPVVAAPDRAVAAASERIVENLATFARVYGYVRFFYPGDEAAAIDWDAFAVLGAETVRDAPNAAALQRSLQQLFHPIAPALRIDGPAGADTLPAAERFSAEHFVHWQHLGVKLHNDPGPYRSQRVVTGGVRLIRRELFPDTERRATRIEKEIGQDLRIRMPLELPADASGHTSREMPADFTTLKARLDAVKLAQRDAATDPALHAAGVMVAWNIFQHFHPYLDSIGAKWDHALRPALHNALAAQSRENYYAALSELVAKLQDGHGYVYGRDAKMGGLPIRVAVIKDQLVLTAVKGETPLHRGDILLEVDGAPAMDVVHEREYYVSGSPHLRRYRALNQFGEGPLDSVARFIIDREGEKLTFEIPRVPDFRGFFFNSVTGLELPYLAEIRPGIFYVNIPSVTRDDFEAKLPQLVAARGIIFDQRWDGAMVKNPKGGAAVHLQPTRDIIPHLIDETVQASPMRIPRVTEPDRQNWTWDESTWPVKPQRPRFKGRIVFINEPAVVSYGETCMAIIADYHLATLVGEPTAGTNGNVNFIPLPGGFRIMWTGMEVLKHDRSPFYTVGFPPDYPVERTLAAVKEGRDEFLERAIAVIEGEPTKK